PQMKPIWRFAIASVASLAVWMAVDAAYVAAGQPKGGTDLFDYAFLPCAYLFFLWASWPLFPSYVRYLRGAARGLCALLALIVWVLPAAIAVLQFHVAIGGVL